jgi:hypothetical protein
MSRHVTLLSAALVLGIVGVVTAQTEPAYEMGGPLAGVKLPPFPTEFGEPPGYRGCIQTPVPLPSSQAAPRRCRILFVL